MESTMFLAQIWGPVMLAVGVGVFTSEKYYTRIYRDLDKETLALLVFGMGAIAAGIVHIKFHNTWGTFSQSVVSLLGWMLLLKGILMAVAPKFVDRAGNYEAKSKLIPLAGIGFLILGAYLSWIGYM